MSWAMLGFWVSLTLTMLGVVVLVISNAESFHKTNFFLMVVVMFLVTCLFGHLGDVPTLFDFLSVVTSR